MKKAINFYIVSVAILLSACAAKIVKTPNEVSYGKDAKRKISNELSVYRTQGLCNGLPRVQEVNLAPGFCLGLVDSGEGLGKPRYALQLDPTRILLVDMGGWTANTGRLYMLTKSGRAWSRSELLTPAMLGENEKCLLDRPFQPIRGPGGKLYLTAASCVGTIDPLSANVASSVRIILRDLPDDGLHSLKAIAFDPAGNMYMNVGSVSDNCEMETSDTCEELENRALIRKYAPDTSGGYGAFTVFARGQRNSMALHWDTLNGMLWAGENSRDYIERKEAQLNGEEKPSDEFNIISEGANLDWPYCYDNGQKSPEFPNAVCSQYQDPHLLFPAHSAPLSFLKYTGTLFPPFYRDRLLVTFHGYRAYGHRIVTYEKNERGEPTGDPLSVVYGWDANTEGRMVGAPVGITQGLDGSVFIVEDTPKKVLQLYYNASEGNGTPVAELSVGSVQQDQSAVARGFRRAEERRRVAFVEKLEQENVPLFTQIQSRILDQHCARCHAGVTYPGMQILRYDDIGNYKKLKDMLMPLLTGDGLPQMPLGGLPEESREELIGLVQRWLDAGSPEP